MRALYGYNPGMSHPVPPPPNAPRGGRVLLRVTGVLALLAFLTPAGYVVKFYAFDRPREEARTVPLGRLSPGEARAKRAALTASDPDNLLLQARVARQDADPQWRREAIQALGRTLRGRDVMVRRPLETLTAKAALAEAAERDPEPSVRAAAAQTLGEVAQQGAVVRR